MTTTEKVRADVVLFTAYGWKGHRAVSPTSTVCGLSRRAMTELISLPETTADERCRRCWPGATS